MSCPISQLLGGLFSPSDEWKKNIPAIYFPTFHLVWTCKIIWSAKLIFISKIFFERPKLFWTKQKNNSQNVYIIKAGVCLSVCLSTLKCTNVTSPPVLKLWDSHGHIWLLYDLMKVIKLIEETFGQKKNSEKRLYVIPSALVSFLPYYILSFLPD